MSSSSVFETKRAELDAIQASFQAEIDKEGETVEVPRGYGRGAPFTVESMIRNVSFFPQDATIGFSNIEFPDMRLMSFRQYPDTSTLGRSSSVPVTVADFVAAMEWHIGKIQRGCKGGFYQIGASTPVFATWSSESTDEIVVCGFNYDDATHHVTIVTVDDGEPDW